MEYDRCTVEKYVAYSLDINNQDVAETFHLKELAIKSLEMRDMSFEKKQRSDDSDLSEWKEEGDLSYPIFSTP